MTDDRLTKTLPFYGYYVLLWSESQKAFHIEQLGRCVSRNTKAYYRKVPLDWVMVGAYPTRSECSGLRRMLEENRAILESNPLKDEYKDERRRAKP